jgi:hypothetical protein
MKDYFLKRSAVDKSSEIVFFNHQPVMGSFSL